MITFYEQQNGSLFKLDTSASTYILRVGAGGYLLHVYYGARLDEADITYIEVREGHDSTVPLSASVHDWRFSPDTATMEYPCFGSGDFRISALKIKNNDNNSVTDFRYSSHRIYEGKPSLPGMPSTSASESEADTLELTGTDITGAAITLYYTVYRELPVLTRHVSVKNTSENDMYLQNAYSACFDFSHPAFDIMHFWGCWGRERRTERQTLPHGITSFASKRGASGHYNNPSAVLLAPGASETAGDVYGFAVAYSGNFDISAEYDSFGTTRLLLGINPAGFEWKLEPGEEFYTPEVISVFSGNGLGDMSRAFHKLFRKHLSKSTWQNKPRPVVVNNWEATYFHFDDDKLVMIAKDAAQLGIDMLVMDDGWFGARNNSDSSLGDWYENKSKLKHGLKNLVERVNELGVGFGIWFEPEMVSPDSDLYRAHPDWCLHTEGRDKSIARAQYVLDLTRSEVCDYIFDSMSAILSMANIEYVKWDFNRNLTEVSTLALPKERQGEVFHRYVLGLYSILERLTNAFPKLLLEGCASGGGRYDAAMLYYFPQYWTSDDTDPIERLHIGYGTTMIYPAATMSCHVSASPNHQTGRITSLDTRGNVTMAGVFGYELDLNRLTDDEKAAVKNQVEQYKEYSSIIMDGELYRLETNSDDATAWSYVSADKKEALVTFVVINSRIAPVYFLRLDGLDPDTTYRITLSGIHERKRRELAIKSELKGSTLMRAGLNMTRNWRDADSVQLYLTAVDGSTENENK